MAGCRFIHVLTRCIHAQRGTVCGSAAVVSVVWICVGENHGSHHIFEKNGERPISVPVHHGKVKYGYVRRIKKAFEAD
jgi:hypothetical protein